jgi:3-phenylpropionate/cinnamic acid dioxygenase small subunit
MHNMGDMDIPAVHDKLEIHELLARYARGVDDHDWDLYRSVFTGDAHIDYTSAGGIAGSRDEVASWLEAVFNDFPWTQHYITNVEIDLDGDAAATRASFYNPMHFPGLAEPSACGGYYQHDLVRTAEGWKSRRLIEHNSWFINPPR